jgi:hypothetical protein
MGAFDLSDYGVLGVDSDRPEVMGRVTQQGLLITASGLRVVIPPSLHAGSPVNTGEIIVIATYFLGIRCPTCYTQLYHGITYENETLHAIKKAEQKTLMGRSGEVE